MLTLYFSGTGNTRYIANDFAKKMNHKAYSIEENLDFVSLITSHETIAFCYPIYTSDVPNIMKRFVNTHRLKLQNKNLIILCTQLFFSGDGARVFTDLLKDITYTVIYAEHINMPNNICNLWVLPLAKEQRIARYLDHAESKLNKICENIEQGIIILRGFNPVSKWLGWFTQRAYFPKIETKAMKDVRIDAKCNLCGTCTRVCPMDNLTIENNQIIQQVACTLCYRCVNLCPQKAITVLIHSKVKKQYRYWLFDCGLQKNIYNKS